MDDDNFLHFAHRGRFNLKIRHGIRNFLSSVLYDPVTNTVSATPLPLLLVSRVVIRVVVVSGGRPTESCNSGSLEQINQCE